MAHIFITRNFKKVRDQIKDVVALSNFNYFPLVWMLSSVKYLDKIENLQKQALRFMVLDYESSYDELLRLSGSCAINVSLKRNLCEEPQFYVRDFSDPQN